MNKKILRGYIYPYTAKEGVILNAYINNFMNSLKGRIEFVNSGDASAFGLFTILKYIRKIDMVFLNWPEDIPEKKGGIPQSIFYIFLICCLKLMKVSVFLTFHNKTSHFNKKAKLKNFIRNFTVRKADYILTHAREGIPVVKSISASEHTVIKFIHHPLLPFIELKVPETRKYDVLLWGMVTPYKGIDRFLQFITDEKLENLKILVAGKISDNNYRDKIMSYRNKQIEITDAFVSLPQLEEHISHSKAVLFTYLEYSILSSGSLMDTLRYAPLIIGPNYGAFKDIHEEGLIEVYDDYAQLKNILNNLNKVPFSPLKIQKFVNENTWDHFGSLVYDLIKSH
jgi:beta-1,4-mannosyltransferase